MEESNIDTELACKSFAEGYAVVQPEWKWNVTIPFDGNFVINYVKLTRWQRFWMRFIGWKVEAYK